MAGRAHTGVLGLAVAALALLALAPLSQAKTVVDGFGTQSASNVPAFGGQVGSPLGIAVNNSGNGAAAGTAYVVDSADSRIQRFSSSGAFQRTWGQDVIATTVNEQQKVTINASGGTYTLSFNGDTTDPIPYNIDIANDQTVTESLAALPSINGTTNVSTKGSNFVQNTATYIVTFKGALGGADQPPLTVDTSNLTGTVTVSPVANGEAVPENTGTGFETCTVATHCQAGSTSDTTANGGQLNEPQGIAVDQGSGNVYVTEQGNQRVSEFDADGNFIRAFGWDVITTGQPSDTGTGFEVCAVASECEQGASGANGGEFGNQIGYPVIDSSFNVWIPDASNRRIQEFDSSGNFIAAYGYDVDAFGGGGAMEKCTSTAVGACKAGTEGSAAGQFSFNSPRQIAFDNLDNLYAIDSENNRVQKFDPTLLASVSNFGTATFPAYTTQAPQQLIATQGGTRLVFSVNNNVSGGGERQLLEIDPSDASVKDTSLIGSKLNDVSGIGANTTSGSLYATTSASEFSGSPRKVYILSSTPLASDPAITLSPVLAKTDTTATFDGAVDPQGGLVSCTFQYSTNQETWTDVAEPDCAGLTENGGVQAVTEVGLGLQPATHYFVRLAVSRPLVPNSTKTSSVQQFDTVAPPPVVSIVGAFDIEDTTVRMGGTINPQNSATSYVFEYGTTAALGHSTPPLDVGGGTTPIIVSQLVDGLSSDTTYHYRLVATNATGPTPSLQKTFHTRAAPLPLPEGRSYEMVSPPDKNGGDADIILFGSDSRASVASDGEAVGFCSLALFGETPSQFGANGCTGYLSRRTAAGWQTTNTFPRYCFYNTVTGEAGEIGNQFLSPDLTRAVTAKYEPIGCSIAKLDPAAPFSPTGGSANLYLQDLTGEKEDSANYRLIAPQVPAAEAFLDASDDFSHIFFRSAENQTASPDSPAQESFRKIYEWIEPGPDCGEGDPSYQAEIGACLRLVSRKPNGEPFTTPSNLASVEGEGNTSEYARNAVSADGERIYFNNAATFQGLGDSVARCETPNCKLFMREGGVTTYEVSKSECTETCDPLDSFAEFKWATPDGSVALFKSCDRLTNDAVAGCQLYRWDRNLPEDSRLASLGYDGLVIGTSADGDIVYTYGEHSSPFPSAGEKIRRWHWSGGSPDTEILATLTVGDSKAQQDQYRNARSWDDRVTPSGKYLMLNVSTPLDPTADSDESRDIYRWSEQDGWVCASCQLPGVPSMGDANTGTLGHLSANVIPGSSYQNRKLEPKISSDGQRIFFDTPDALVPSDVNGESGCAAEGPSGYLYETMSCSDVYEWNDGRIGLISSGTSSTDSFLLGADPSGRDVYFYTRQKLVGWDVDNNVDIYDARVGGGFPEPPPQPPGCEGESCRGETTSPSGGAGAATAVFQGPPNPTPEAEKSCSKKKHRVRRNGKVRCISRHATRHEHRARNRNRKAGR